MCYTLFGPQNNVNRKPFSILLNPSQSIRNRGWIKVFIFAFSQWWNIFLFLFDVSSLGDSCSFRREWRPLPPASGGTTQNRWGSGLQRDGRERAKLPNLHLSHHPRGRGWATRRIKKGRSATVCQRSGEFYPSACWPNLESVLTRLCLDIF